MEREKTKQIMITLYPSEAEAIRALHPEKNLSKAIRLMKEVSDLITDYGEDSFRDGRNKLILELYNKKS